MTAGRGADRASAGQAAELGEVELLMETPPPRSAWSSAFKRSRSKEPILGAAQILHDLQPAAGEVMRGVWARRSTPRTLKPVRPHTSNDRALGGGRAVPLALLTGLCIAAYTLVDGRFVAAVAEPGVGSAIPVDP